MADPQELQEAADAIFKVIQLPAVQRHPELDGPLRAAEEWARTQYRKVREEISNENPAQAKSRVPLGRRRP